MFYPPQVSEELRMLAIQVCRSMLSIQAECRSCAGCPERCIGPRRLYNGPWPDWGRNRLMWPVRRGESDAMGSMSYAM